ncbi:MAG: MmgE/PrpD family protein [Burkholderiaceae bacterium]
MHIAASMHPSAPIVPSALALAEHMGADGSDTLRAIAVGIETALRLGEAVNPAHYERGWHATATLGRFGAAAAAGLLLGLTREQMTAALGLAGTQAAGLKEVFGSMAKPLHAGQAARDGVMAALLAARGYSSAATILEGPRGFAAVMAAGQADWGPLLDDWGARWSARKILYKLHASSFCTQALIEGVIGLRTRHRLSAGNVHAIRAEVSRMSLENARIGEPATGMEGKFSLPHAAAQALCHGQATEADFTDARVAEPALRELRRRTTIRLGPELGWAQARVSIDTVDGRTVTDEVDLHRRTAEAHDKWRVVRAKFDRLAAPVLGEAASEVLAACVAGLDRVRDIRELSKLV